MESEAEEPPVKKSNPSETTLATSFTKLNTLLIPLASDLNASCTGSNCAAINPPTSNATPIPVASDFSASFSETCSTGDASPDLASIAASLVATKFLLAIFF